MYLSERIIMETAIPSPLAMPQKRQLPEPSPRQNPLPPQKYTLAKQAWVARFHPGIAQLSSDLLAGRVAFLTLELYGKLDPSMDKKTAAAFEAACEQLAEREMTDGSWRSGQRNSLRRGKKRAIIALRWAKRLLDDPYGIADYYTFDHGGRSPIYACEILEVALKEFDEQGTEA
jgi:hypothetical protein